MDWNRFCKVVAKDFRNMWPMFGTTMIILAALPFAAWLIVYVFGGGDAHMPADMRLIPGIKNNCQRSVHIYYAMLPASKAEKFCSALLFSLIVCPLAVYLGSLVLDVFLTVVPFGPWQEWIWQGEMGFPFTFNMAALNEVAPRFNEDADVFLLFGTMYNVCCWIGYIATVLMFVFTSTIFKRHKVLQTILWLYVINFVLSIVLVPVMVAVFSDSSFVDWFMQLPERMSGEAMANWLFGLALGFDVLMIVLFGWLSWRRLNRMAY